MMLTLAIATLIGCTGAVGPSGSPANGPLSIATSSVPAAAVGQTYSTSLVASGGTPPYTWTIAKGALPSGLQLNSFTGAIAGTAASSGNFSITAEVEDAKSSFSSAALALEVGPAVAPTISGVSPTSGPAGGGTTVTITGTNFGLANAVDFGSIRAAAFQVVSATEVRAVTAAGATGVVSVTVNASDDKGATAKNEFTFTAASASGGLAVSVSAPANGASVSGAVSLAASASDAQSAIRSVQFHVDGSNFGAALSAAPYAISWDSTRVADGAHSFYAVVTDAAGKTATSATVDVTVKNTAWNPSVLGVSWAGDFAKIAANEIDVKQDSRLSVKATGNGTTDDTAAIRAAIQLASSTGGGVVYFPSGNYKIVASSGSPKGNPLSVPSRVILRGSGSATTRLYVNDLSAGSETDGTWTWGGINFGGASLAGMTDLGVYLVNSASTPAALIWNRGTPKVSEVFFNNLDVHLDNGRAFWMESTNELLVQGSSIECTSTANGPVYMVMDSNFAFLKNKVTYLNGRVQMQNNTNLVMQGNALVRDAQNRDMDDKTAIESGGVELSFGNTISVLDNTVQTLNAPADEAGDGEAIMTQQSVVQDVLDAGSATAVTSNTLTDAKAPWGSVTVSRLAQYPVVVAILSGPAMGEFRTVQSVNTSSKTLTVSQAWNPEPAPGDLYSLFSWTVMHATIQGNTLIDNPNGIVIYDGCYDCTVQGNTLTNSRQIILRVADDPVSAAAYPEGRRSHLVAIGGKITNNTVSNTSGIRPAYIALDVETFAPGAFKGMSISNVQVSGNTVVPYSANPSKTYPNPRMTEIMQDGLFPCFEWGPSAALDPVTTLFQSISVTNNSQSAPIAYAASFVSATTRSCVSNSGN